MPASASKRACSRARAPGVSYALIVCFDDLSITHRLRAHEAFRTLGHRT